MSTELPVLAAVDGSESALDAVRWAAAEAARRRTWLRVVSVHPWPIAGYPDTLVDGRQLLAGLRAQTKDNLNRAVDAAAAEEPDLEIRSEALEGDVVAHLRDASRGAVVLVLGSRGLGGFSGMLLGSTAVALVAHGHCPVVVVRGDHPSLEGRVLVGVDGSDTDDAALAFAFEYAKASGSSVAAVHAWSDVVLEAARAAGYAQLDWEPLARGAAELLTSRLDPWRAKFPEVAVEPLVARARPARLLLDQAVGAALVVVGSRGRGGVAGMLLGSTSQALIRHAPCPVAVVRPRAEQP
ncbi:universal stress protein [Actinokineospora auranticolor]|uniref:Nucleotide-binding universal stress UspA family protein n=1 Tax=Actinokineospora auranticolor TaxID=155976 RepID=A0A2S6GCG9_9PSEU|nr:universal stress protein [Actinokineospora auranticolor]PPK62543.1 nucleotide-binding universal stress UspA family protein [Actinokineospora auranticolor]